ncbi:decarboxylating NADP(+)-dependent phosphogluconate dehydrogenase [Cysteiniphilum sp. QT6929]|uniref:decarboxylating NADP(+)-dependent phosphogluconate dehydrogenase n=1 Tax=Cysteiniphilum sp. QT6929 TaxID=2975055 RepID=UPI0024B38DBF|nr:decarboxylating NADP(+)-dependent phosphogluconate dehydrogenase [Cysteiniphilum sp. QT6929]WHN65207.1 decarboxylating NADP(+)-dependent phosphogluconate dehydrogenase [Cysteiniphilum sp. QT6929]
MQAMQQKGDIAVIGLAVMGQNLILNMNDHGFHVVAYNRTTSKVDEFLNGNAKGTNIIGAYSIEDMVSKLKSPRKIMLMVKAGDVVDQFIDALVPHLNKGDIIIDGGNSNFTDSERRTHALKAKGIYFIGTGVSGGEEGARFGPSMMPGGMPEAWGAVKPIFQAIAAKTPAGEACCEWVGNGGAGHFVKMVHNGIEYGDMQLICEAYQFMKDLLGLDNEQLSEIFERWNKTELDSYLIEITANILKFKDAEGYVIDHILDTAGQKGTGKWTGINALDLGIPLTLIAESVFARCISAQKDIRVEAEAIYGKKSYEKLSVSDALLHDLQQSLLFAKIISYAQGYMLMQEASKHYHWDLNYGDIALMWREGCIIRSVFLDKIKTAFDNNAQLQNLLFDDYFKEIISKALPSVRRIVAKGIEAGVAMPALTSSLSFFDGFTTGRLPANLLQAQRDYFGAHTYERLDKARGEFFHTDWIGSNSNVSSTGYSI